MLRTSIVNHTRPIYNTRANDARSWKERRVTSRQEIGALAGVSSSSSGKRGNYLLRLPEQVQSNRERERGEGVVALEQKRRCFTEKQCQKGVKQERNVVLLPRESGNRVKRGVTPLSRRKIKGVKPRFIPSLAGNVVLCSIQVVRFYSQFRNCNVTCATKQQQQQHKKRGGSCGAYRRASEIASKIAPCESGFTSLSEK